MTQNTTNPSFMKHYREALNKIKQWSNYYKDGDKVMFLVKDDLHWTRSPGRRKAYQDWLQKMKEQYPFLGATSEGQ